ncbi:MAG TPA: hypothetical protein VMD59_05010, partial [Acidimicrobiales bacterium]|nr:hypothetical protein [Acidimicrobiales bacterium]
SARRAVLGLSAAAAALGGVAAFGAAAGATPAAGIISTVAGTGVAGYAGDGSAATSAMLSRPYGVATDAAGDLAIADTTDHVVRFVPASTGSYFGRPMTAGDIYTIAGNGTPGFSGDGGPATLARLDDPAGVAFDAAGGVVVTDMGDDDVRVIADGQASGLGITMTAGDIYSLAGSPGAGYSGDGGPATMAKLHAPVGVAVDTDGVVIADIDNNAVRYLDTTAGTFFGIPMSAGDIYTIAGTGAAGYNGDGRPAVSAELDVPVGVALDSHGDLAVTEASGNRVRFVPASSGSYYGQAMAGGDIYTVAGTGAPGYSGDGGPAQSAEISEPLGVAFDGLGDLAFSDSQNHVVRFVPAASGTYFGTAMSPADIYTIAGNGTGGSSGDGNPATTAQLSQPFGLAFTAEDSLLLADALADKVREVQSGFSAPTVTSASSASGTVGQPFSLAVAANGTPTPAVSLSGDLPAGLSYTAGSNGAGTISGTPAASGDFTIDVQASNGVAPAATTELSIDVAPAPVTPAPPSTTIPPGKTPQHCTVGHGHGKGAKLDPSSIAGKAGSSSTIEGCDTSTSKSRTVTALVLSPKHTASTSVVKASASGTFRFVTGKLKAGTTVVTFEVGRKVLFVTTIETTSTSHKTGKGSSSKGSSSKGLEA